MQARGVGTTSGVLPRSRCPGCGLQMPVRGLDAYDGYYHTSPECWGVYGEALAVEYSNAIVYGQVHQLTVDTYAVQHAGGEHKDKSVAVHLCGLYLVLERGMRPPLVPAELQRLAAAVDVWPHFPPPARPGSMTLLDVVLTDSPEGYCRAVRAWAGQVWRAWSPHHAAVAQMVAHHLVQRR